MDILIREAEKTDMKAVLGLIQELAVFENAPDEVINTEENLIKDGFGSDKIFDCYVTILDGKTIGFILTYTSYSTWKGRSLYLEDFYIQAKYRGGGIGQKMFAFVVEKAKKLGVKRLEWQVLDWNEPAIKFYEKAGATIDKEWYNGRMFF